LTLTTEAAIADTNSARTVLPTLRPRERNGRPSIEFLSLSRAALRDHPVLPVDFFRTVATNSTLRVELTSHLTLATLPGFRYAREYHLSYLAQPRHNCVSIRLTDRISGLKLVYIRDVGAQFKHGHGAARFAEGQAVVQPVYSGDTSLNMSTRVLIDCLSPDASPKGHEQQLADMPVGRLRLQQRRQLNAPSPFWLHA
jgi:hypothetical protein